MHCIVTLKHITSTMFPLLSHVYDVYLTICVDWGQVENADYADSKQNATFVHF